MGLVTVHFVTNDTIDKDTLYRLLSDIEYLAKSYECVHKCAFCVDGVVFMKRE